MFAGLISRWIRLFPWAAARPEAISRPIRSTKPTDRGPAGLARAIVESDIPCKKFHSQEKDALSLADLVDRDDVVMLDRRRGLCLVHEPSLDVWCISARSGLMTFRATRTGELCVLGQED